MAPKEFYIREASETSARGPYNLDQIQSLAANGTVTPQTLFYDAGTEAWVALGADADAAGQVFPQQRKLALKAREKAMQEMETLNRPSSVSRPPISVDDMLAAAEGKTVDTKGKRDPAIAAALAARLGMRAAIVALLLASAGEALPASDACMSMDMGKILQHPILFLGVADFAMAIMLWLGATAIYPVVRFRAALGLGFFGILFFSAGMGLPLLAAVAGSAGLYLTTILLDILPVVAAGAICIAGLGGVTYFLLQS